jgi:flagellar biosynthesis/type III secretory pathway chaperone
MIKTDHLCKIMSAQAELMDAIMESLTGAQQALVESNGEVLEYWMRREEELLRPFRDLEQDRLHCVEEIAGCPKSVQQLIPDVPEEERSVLQALSNRMRASASRIMEINLQNSLLLRNALRFVQETLRAVTDDNRRKLVDERM